MKTVVPCPHCNGIAFIRVRVGVKYFRQLLLRVPTLFYKCKLCKTEFTTNSSDTVTLSGVRDVYRTRKSLTKKPIKRWNLKSKKHPR